MLSLEDTLFYTDLGVELEDACHDESANRFVIQLRYTASQAECRACGYLSGRVHSRRQRKPSDLPLAGRNVQFSLQIRRFFCDNAGCAKRTFAEQVPSLLPFRARRTVRQTELLTEQAFALGGEAGARTLAKMGVTVSPDTLLRLISKTPLPLHETPRVLGVDDWAFRKGRTYGTILVDLEKRQVVDLLPERSAESLATWLRARPGIPLYPLFFTYTLSVRASSLVTW
jgi:transposase